jgi:hypothetical protein
MTEPHKNFSGRALIVTVSENRSPTIPSLGAAVESDGEAIMQILRNIEICGYNDSSVQHLSGKQATLANINTAILNAAKSLEPEDPFLFFYSGHGGMDDDGGILAPYDADMSNDSGILKSADLAKMMKSLPSKRKLLVIDACHSGGLTLTAPITKSAKPLSNSILRELESGEGSVVIASSRSTESSYIQPGDPLSLFTKHIVAALRGAAGHDSEGFVRVFDLFNFVAENVRKEMPQQSPVYAAYHQDSNFPVAYCAATEKRQKSVDTTSATFSTTLLDTFCALYPLGPIDQDIWIRAGGDLSRIRLTGTGRLDWSRAIREIELGSATTENDIIQAATEDYPYNRKLSSLIKAITSTS